jgi:hypothetical protein
LSDFVLLVALRSIGRDGLTLRQHLIRTVSEQTNLSCIISTFTLIKTLSTQV